jgi:hypothetical protein
MGVKFPENSSSENKNPTRKHYRAKPFGGDSAPFSRTSVLQSEIVLKSHLSVKKTKCSGATPVDVSTESVRKSTRNLPKSKKNEIALELRL